MYRNWIEPVPGVNYTEVRLFPPRPDDPAAAVDYQRYLDILGQRATEAARRMDHSAMQSAIEMQRHMSRMQQDYERLYQNSLRELRIQSYKPPFSVRQDARLHEMVVLTAKEIEAGLVGAGEPRRAWVSCAGDAPGAASAHLITAEIGPQSSSHPDAITIGAAQLAVGIVRRILDREREHGPFWRSFKYVPRYDECVGSVVTEHGLHVALAYAYDLSDSHHIVHAAVRLAA